MALRSPTADDLARMRSSVFFEGSDIAKKRSRFWVLLILAAIIAAAGVVADSTATVIGAMIVAPLMTPILGTMLAVVLADRHNLVRSIGLVVAGALAAIAVGFLLGLLSPNDVVAATNGQVASRVNPRLIDLVAALATGVVGSVALVRSDISDTLPGVAIAISLVPPLTVVGLTAASGELGQAAGALLLFVTNVAAILATGVVVMWMYGVQRFAAASGPADESPASRRHGVAVIAGLFVTILAVLTFSSIAIARDTARQSTISSATSTWAEKAGWSLLDVSVQGNKMIARVIGPPPLPNTAELAALLDQEGIDPSTVAVELIPEVRFELES